MKQNVGGALQAATGDSVLKSRPSETASHLRMSSPAGRCERFPLNKGGGGNAARGVVLPVGESHDSADRMSNAASSSLSLPTLPDNPRAAGAAPFSKRELLVTARSVQFFHGFPLWMWWQP